MTQPTNQLNLLDAAQWLLQCLDNGTLRLDITEKAGINADNLYEHTLGNLRDAATAERERLEQVRSAHTLRGRLAALSCATPDADTYDLMVIAYQAAEGKTQLEPLAMPAHTERKD